jgi:phage-related protein
MADDNTIKDILNRSFKYASNGLEDIAKGLTSSTEVIKDYNKVTEEQKENLSSNSNLLEELFETVPELSKEYEKEIEAHKEQIKQINESIAQGKVSQTAAQRAIGLQNILLKNIKKEIDQRKSSLDEKIKSAQRASLGTLDISADMVKINASNASLSSGSLDGGSSDAATATMSAPDAVSGVGSLHPTNAAKEAGGVIADGLKESIDKLNDTYQNQIDKSTKEAVDNKTKDDSEKFYNSARARIADISSMLTGGASLTQVLFKGAANDAIVFGKEMRNIAYEVEGIGASTRGLQKEFANLGKDISQQTGVPLEVMQETYVKNLKKGMIEQNKGTKSQKEGLKVIKSGLNLSSMIGSGAEATADLFGDWHRTLKLSSGQMSQLARDTKQIAKSTGVTGDNLIDAMKSSEGILKNLYNQGNLTNSAMKNVIKSMAQAKKMGVEDTFGKLGDALSSTNKLFFEADDSTKSFLFQMAARIGEFDSMSSGTFMQSRSKMKKMGEGMESMMIEMAQGLGADVKNFDDLNKLTEDQRKKLAIQLKARTGMEIAEFEKTALAFRKGGESLGDTLAGFDKTLSSGISTIEERKKAQEDIDRTMREGGLSMLKDVSEKIRLTGGDVSSALGQMDSDFQEDMASIAQRMGKDISKMTEEQKFQVAGIASAESLQKAAKEKGVEVEDFSSQLKSAMAKGDTVAFRDIVSKMDEASEKVDIRDKSSIDPVKDLGQKLKEMNESIRGPMSQNIQALVDTIGSMGLLFTAIAAEMAALTFAVRGWGFDVSKYSQSFVDGSLSFLKSLGSGKGIKNSLWSGIGGAIKNPFLSMEGTMGEAARQTFMNSMKPMFSAISKMAGPLALAFGAIKGFTEAKDAGRTKAEGTVLGMLTGGAKTGSFMSETLGVEKGSTTDKALGVAGAAAWGAAVGSVIPVVGTVLGAVVGAVIELVKILTEGTTILADIVAPFQNVFDGIYSIIEGIGGIIFGLVTLDIERVFKNIVGVLGGAFKASIGAILSIFIKTIPGVVRLIFAALQAVFVTFPLWLGKQLFSGLQAVFFTFPTWLGKNLLSGLQAVFVTFPTWLGKNLLSGLQAVFVTFPTWLIGGLMSAIRAVFVTLPTWIATQFMNAFNWIGSIGSWMQSGLSALSENEWIGPIFQPIRDAFNIIGESLMTIINPIRGAFEGLYEVFVTIGNSILDAIRPIYDAFASLGQMFFGVSDGGSALSGVMSVIQIAVKGLATVIGLLLQPVVWLSHAIGFVIRLVGSLVDAIIEPFRWLYDVLVGHSIVPDLVVGIVSWFAKLPILIFKSLLTIPQKIGELFSNIGSYLESFSSVPLFGPIVAQIGNIINFIGNAISILATGLGHVISIIEGIFSFDGTKILEGLSGIGSTIIQSLSNIGQFLYKSLYGAISGIFRMITLIPSLVGKAIISIGSMVTAIPSLIAKAYSNIGSYLQSFGTDSIFGTIITQIGTIYKFIGSTISNVVNAVKGVFDILSGIVTLDFGKIWDGIKTIGSALVSQISNFGGFVYGLLRNSMQYFLKTIKKIPLLFFKSMKSTLIEFPKWLLGKVIEVAYYFGNFLSRIPGLVYQGFVNSIKKIGKFIYDVITWPFRKIYEGVVWMGSKIKDIWNYLVDGFYSLFDFSAWGNWISESLSGAGELVLGSLSGLGSWIYGAFESGLSGLGSLGSTIVSGLYSAFVDFPVWLVGQLMSGLISVGSLIASALYSAFIEFPVWLFDQIVSGLSSIGNLILDGLKSAFIDFPVLLFDQITSGLSSLGSTIFSGLKSAFVDLPTYIFDGFKSALQGIWDWIKSWIPGMKTAESTIGGYNENAVEQAKTMAEKGPSTAHAAGGLVGAGADLLQLDVGEAASKAGLALKEGVYAAGENLKNAAESAWGGVKAVGSYLNPFNYFQEGTRKIEQPGLAMLHEGEMVIPADLTNKITAKGNGPFNKPEKNSINQSVNPAFLASSLGLGTQIAKESKFSLTEVGADLSALTDDSVLAAIKKSFDFTKGIGNKIIETAKSGFNFVKSVGPDISSFAKEGFENLSNFATKPIETFKSLATKPVEMAKGLITNMKSDPGFLGKATNAVVEKAGKLTNTVRSLATKPIETVKSLATKPIETVKSLATKPIETVKSLATKPIETVKSLATKPIETVKSLATKPIETVKSLATKPIENVKSLATKPIETVKSLATKPVEVAKGLITNMKSDPGFIGKATNTITEKAGKLTNTVKSLATKPIETVKSLATKPIETVKSLATKPVEMAKGLMTNMKSDPGFVGKATNTITEKAGKLTNTVRSLATKPIETVKSLATKPIETVKSLATKPIETVKSLATKPVEVAKGLITNMKSDPGFVGKAINTITEKAGKLAQGAKSLATKPIETVKSLATKPIETVKSLATKPVEMAKGLMTNMKSDPGFVGKATNTITEKAGKLTNTVKSLATKPIETVKSLATKPIETVKSLATKPVEMAKGLMTNMKSDPGFVGKATNTITEKAGKLTNTVKSLATKPIETAKSLATKPIEVAKGIMTNMKSDPGFIGKSTNTITEKAGKLAQGAKSLATKPIETVKSLATKPVEIAKGLMTNMKSDPGFVGKATNTITEKAGKLAQGAKSLFSTSSSANSSLIGKGMELAKNVGGKGAELAKGLGGKAMGMAGKLASSPVGKVAMKVGGKALPFLGLLTGGVSGAMEAKETGRSTLEASVLGAITGDAKTGSTMSKYLGIEEGSTTDKMLGVGGAAATGAMTGAAIGSIVPVIGTAIGAGVGGLLGGGAELYKWWTEKKPEKTPEKSLEKSLTPAIEENIPKNLDKISQIKTEDSKQKEGWFSSIGKTLGGAALGTLVGGPIGGLIGGALGAGLFNKKQEIPKPPADSLDAINNLNTSIDGSLSGSQDLLNKHAIPMANPKDVEARPITNTTTDVQPVHLRDIGQTILREKTSANSGTGKLQSDELTRMEETAYKQVEELEQIKEGINELVALMRPRGGSSVAGPSNQISGSTKDPRRPMQSAVFGKMKFGYPSGTANKDILRTGE